MFKTKSSVRTGLNVIIVGYGKVGQTLVEQLSTEGHQITVIDTNSQKIQDVVNAYDVMGVVGNGASFSVQTEAAIEEADLIIAVTGSDELNLLCCTIAKQVGECAAIARVRTPDYSKESGYLKEQLGLAMIINPELESANEIARILSLKAALEVNTFAHGQAELVKYKIPENNTLNGMTLVEFSKNYSDILICAIERAGDITIPSGDYQLAAGDVISFVTSRNVAKSFLERIGVITNRVKEAMIIGGGKVGYYLAKQLVTTGIDVKIIEMDKERCEKLSTLLPNATIINGNGANQDLLKEEDIESVDAFIATTGIDEENVMLTLYAKQMSEAKLITKVNRTNFKSVISELDLGSVIYPRYITTEAIIAYVRAKKNSMNSNIETLYHMFDQRVEAIEFLVEQDSAVTDVSLMDLPLKKNLLISFISRNGRIIIPSGQECIKKGDTVMIVTTHTGFNDIQDILVKKN